MVKYAQSGPESLETSRFFLIKTACSNWFVKPLSRSKHLSLGSKNESYALSALKDTIMLDSSTHLERGPIEFGLVQSKSEHCLASSIDGF